MVQYHAHPVLATLTARKLDFPTAESVAALWGTFSSPHSFHSGAGSQRPGAVKGAPFFGAAKRTLE
jgi:hypothetical protein